MASTDWDLFQTLHAVLEAGSLSAAARARGLTQPTLGRHIDELERRLGAPLFLRSPRGLIATDLANTLRSHLEDMSSAAAAAVRDASGADGEGGVVRVTASEIMGVEAMPRILTDFRIAHPKIDVELVLSNRNEDLSRRDADIAVRMARPTQNTLVARRVGELHFGFYATAEYLERNGVPRSIDDLDDHTIIGYDKREIPAAGELKIGRAISRDLFALRADNDIAQLAFLRAGYGIGVCQHQLAQRSGLIHILAGSMAFKLEVWIAMHENLKGSKRMRLMFDHLVEGLTNFSLEAGR